MVPAIIPVLIVAANPSAKSVAIPKPVAIVFFVTMVVAS
ncbi:hypothetical protein PG5_01070 [Pseudomonas sp. G5(2012)]|jgi:hypothetical protein|nr:hypothetical protein PG5_01070 [Pseudomonas sp. G5(2012)]